MGSRMGRVRGVKSTMRSKFPHSRQGGVSLSDLVTKWTAAGVAAVTALALAAGTFGTTYAAGDGGAAAGDTASAQASNGAAQSGQTAEAAAGSTEAAPVAANCDAVTTWADLKSCVEGATSDGNTITKVHLSAMIAAGADGKTARETIVVPVNAEVSLTADEAAGVTGSTEGKAALTRSASVFSVSADATLTIESGTYKDLTTSENGALVQMLNDGDSVGTGVNTLNINGGTFQNNKARNGGVVFTAGNNATVNVVGGLFEGNIAYDPNVNNEGNKGGGALYVKGTTKISGGTFRNNAQKPEGCEKGDIQSGDPCWKNRSGGGAIYSLGDLTIQGSVKFEANQASAWSFNSGGGAVWAKGTLRIANVTTYDKQGNPTVERPQFDGNYASVTAPETTADGIEKIWNGGAGGAVFLEEASVAYVTGGTFTNNASGYLGGAIYTEFNSTTYVGRSVSTKNTAGHFGGGLWFCPSGSSTASEGGNIALFDNAVNAKIDANTKNLPATAGFPTEAGADLAIMNPYKKWADSGKPDAERLGPNSFKLLSSWFTDRTKQTVTWYKDGTPVTEASGFYDDWMSGNGGHTGHGTVAVKAESYELSPRYTVNGENEKVIKRSVTKPESTTLFLYVGDSPSHEASAAEQSDDTTTKLTTGVALKAEVMPEANREDAIGNAQILIENNAARLSGGGFGSNGVVSFSTPYTVSWEKAAAKLDGTVADTLLNGSEWTLSIKDEDLADKKADSPYLVEDFRPYKCLTAPDSECWKHDKTAGKWTVTIRDNSLGDTNPDDGRFGVENLQPGKYTLKESKAPTGYELNGQEFTFTIDPPTGNAIPQEPTLYVDGQQPTKVDDNRIGDMPQTNGISWSKISGVDDVTKIGGSVWKLTQVSPTDNETDVEGYKSIEDCVGAETNPNACNNMKDKNSNAGEFTLTYLPYGTYRLHEIAAPDGYWQPSENVWYQVVVSQDATAWTDANGHPLSTADFRNTPTEVAWQKIDASTSDLLPNSEWTIQQIGDNDQPLEGKKWSLTDCTNANQCQPSANNTPRDVDPAEGKFKVQGLTKGKYRLTESKAPDGYVETDTVYEFLIGLSAPTDKDNNVTAVKICPADSPAATQSSSVANASPAATKCGDVGDISPNNIPNVKAVSVLPFTGGTGLGRLLMGGGFAAAAALAAAVTYEWRRRRALDM